MWSDVSIQGGWSNFHEFWGLPKVFQAAFESGHRFQKMATRRTDDIECAGPRWAFASARGSRCRLHEHAGDGSFDVVVGDVRVDRGRFDRLVACEALNQADVLRRSVEASASAVTKTMEANGLLDLRFALPFCKKTANVPRRKWSAPLASEQRRVRSKRFPFLLLPASEKLQFSPNGGRERNRLEREIRVRTFEHTQRDSSSRASSVIVHVAYRKGDNLMGAQCRAQSNRKHHVIAKRATSLGGDIEKLTLVALRECSRCAGLVCIARHEDISALRANRFKEISPC